ncbi:MAG TPA: nucleoside-diphosphate sugar epimerase/dehydratase [Terracidiphilus sp.]|nr:nucleoside-diphosphate sugar epimerase/dehydratase [Terracidiphilus sp.]
MNQLIRVLTTDVESSLRVRRFLIRTTHLCLFAGSGVAAFWLRFDLHIPASELRHLWFGLAAWLIVKTIVFRLLQLDRGWWRFVSMDDLIRIAIGNLVGSLAAFVVIRVFGPSGFPRAIYILDLFLCFLATSGIRAAVRILREGQETPRGQNEKRTFIYGAGTAGVTLLREIRNNSRLPYRLVGFIDDRPDKQGLRINGVPVRGNGDDVEALVEMYSVQTILIAIPSASGSEMTRILRLCHAAQVECKTIPGMDEVIESNGLANQIREVSVEDLLGRIPVQLEENQIRGAHQGKVVLVTGAAGSIGSELCRQIARFHPARIIGFDAAESPLFEIDREMTLLHPEIPFHPELGSIQNRSRLNDLFSQYRPSVVYHAAAYKHVPMMETHVFEAITNNVFGTFNVASAAMDYGVEDFVMVSSDKAVRPTNVMGATKRVAELLLLGLQNGCTKFVAVRFGNVLGSNGSVIPIFKRQIAAGGPITVTHPEMRRFFMTIPEACQLVLQAAAIAQGGQICVLDMGEPVKIVDLARNLILLSGLRPDEDIKIEFVGMRPGEKLYEELSSLLEDTVPTTHEKIRIFVGSGMPVNDIQSWLESLDEICTSRDVARLVVALKEIVLDYNPSTDLLKRVILQPKVSASSLPIRGAGFRSQPEPSESLRSPVGHSTPQ